MAGHRGDAAPEAVDRGRVDELRCWAVRSEPTFRLVVVVRVYLTMVKGRAREVVVWRAPSVAVMVSV